MSKLLRAAVVALLALPSVAFADAPKPPSAKSEGSAVRVVPQIENTKFVGWKLYAIRAKSRPARAGLQNGDLITKIDGTAVANDEPGTKLLSSILEGPAGGELTITRRGAETKVTVTADKK